MSPKYLFFQQIQTFFFAQGNVSPQVPSQSPQPRSRQTTLVTCPYKNWHVYFPDDGMSINHCHVKQSYSMK